MKRLLACLLLAAALVTNACALEVPTDTTVQNLNGSQQLIKTYTLPPGADPQTLIEDPFEQEGWKNAEKRSRRRSRWTKTSCLSSILLRRRRNFFEHYHESG